MINDIQIFTRKNNHFNYPSYKWNTDSKIFVSGNINLGLNEKIVFNQDNSPSLSKVIKLGKLILNQRSNSIINFKGYRKKIKIEVCSWNEVKIYSGWNENSVLLLYRKKRFVEDINNMFNVIYSQLEQTNRSVRNYYFNLIRPSKPNSFSKFEFKPGDKVRTNPEVKFMTERSGMIWSCEYHSKEQKIFYLIFTKGKIHRRRYEKGELILNE